MYYKELFNKADLLRKALITSNEGVVKGILRLEDCLVGIRDCVFELVGYYNLNKYDLIEVKNELEATEMSWNVFVNEFSRCVKKKRLSTYDQKHLGELMQVFFRCTEDLCDKCFSVVNGKV